MKQFLKQRIDHYSKYLAQGLPVLLPNGEELTLLNFDFEENSAEYLELQE
jgi:hypothetical protein